MSAPFLPTHQMGEVTTCPKSDKTVSDNCKLSVDTYGGKIYVEWDPQAAVTPLGQLPFFIEFLKLGGLFEAWVEDCPLEMTSRNAPSKTNVLGTLLLSILAGHKRYAHVTAIRCDGVNPGLLGMTKIVCEDSLRRGLAKIPQEAGVTWLQRSFYNVTRRYYPLPGLWMWTQVLRFSTGIKKPLWLATIPRNLGAPPIPITRILWETCVLFLMLMSRLAIKWDQALQHPICGKY